MCLRVQKVLQQVQIYARKQKFTVGNTVLENYMRGNRCDILKVHPPPNVFSYTLDIWPPPEPQPLELVLFDNFRAVTNYYNTEYYIF